MKLKKIISVSILTTLMLSGCKYDPGSSTAGASFEVFGAPSDVQVEQLVSTKTGKVFAVTNGGLFIYNIKDGKRTYLFHEEHDNLGGVIVTKAGSIICRNGKTTLRSTDEGVSWKETGPGGDFGFTSAPNGDVWSWATAPSVSGTDLWHSTDDGLSWNAIPTSSIDLTWKFSFGVLPNGNIVVATQTNQYLSTDLGITWQNVGSAFRYNQQAVSAMGKIFFMPYQSTLAKVTDDGMTFHDLTLPDEAELLTVADDGTLIAAGPAYQMNTLFRSNDTGKTWQPLGSLNPPMSVTALLYSEGQVFAGVNGAGVLNLSDNGASWKIIGPNAALIYGISHTRSGDVLAETTNEIVARSGNGNDWSVIQTPFADSYYGSGSSLYEDILALGSTDVIYLSTDDGKNWTRHAVADGPFRHFAFAPGGVIYAASDNHVDRSTDNGATWNHIDAGLPFGGAGSIAANTKQEVYLCSQQSVGSSGIVMHSTDAGNTFTAVSSPSSSGVILSLGMNSKGSVFATSTDLPQTVAVSTTEGASWTQLRISPLDADEVVICTSFDANDYLYVGTSKRILKSKAPM